MNPGIYPALANDEYHAAPGISKSGLDLVARCPALYKARYIDGIGEKEKKQFIDGPALHCSVLEPDRFGERYIIAKGGITRRHKAWGEMEEENPGKTVITEAEYDSYMAAADSVRQFPRAREILKEGQAELSAFHTINGLLVKARPDWIIEDVMVDLKFMASVEKSAFSRACFIYRYFVQAPFYIDVAGAAMVRRFNSFLFLCVEKEPPYLSAIYEATPRMIHQGRLEYQRNLEVYRLCKESDHWPGYNDGLIVPVDLPGWAERALEEEAIYDETF